MPTTRSNAATGDGEDAGPPPNPIMSQEVQAIIQQQVQQQVQQQMLNFIQLQAAQQREKDDEEKEYPTPQFQIREFGDHEKLNGHRNYKSWRAMMELELKSVNLLPFINSECAEDEEMSAKKRMRLDAKTLQYIRLSVSKSIRDRLEGKCCNAFEAAEFLRASFGNGRMQDYLSLHKRFTNLRFKSWFDPQRFVGDFESILTDYGKMGTSFCDEYVTTMFLHKIEGIDDPKSPFFAFYTTITTLPNETSTLDYIKERFLKVAESQTKKLSKPSTSKQDNSNEKETRHHTEEKQKSIKRKSSTVLPLIHDPKSAETLTEKYTPKQLEELKNMSKEEKKRIQCLKCSEYFHDTTQCKNPGRLCFKCHKYSHERKDCPFTLKGG
ncbi:uncharacterized protein LOC135848554 isoform X2 [Planococcus citri]|uniref:uncharacterized protein LOC135848554 isoform X2 n=1 Tax=Planococcus citri TaxID=170843 RepID=UPI0031F98E89